MDNKIVFGLSSTRIDGDIVDEIMDSLDVISPQDWALVSWKRSQSTRFIVHAPVASQSVIHEQGLCVRIRPMTQMVHDMTDSRNEWLQPSLDEFDSPRDEAESTIGLWLAGLWPEEIEPKSIEVETEEEPINRPKLQAVGSKLCSPRADVLKIFGLEQNGTDREGKAFVFSVFGKTDENKDSDTDTES